MVSGSPPFDFDFSAKWPAYMYCRGLRVVADRREDRVLRVLGLQGLVSIQGYGV